jgi:hypothetical protein
VYPSQEVKVGAGILERVYHVVRHIRAGACLATHPSVPLEEDVTISTLRNEASYPGAHAHTWATSAASVHNCQFSIKLGQLKNTHRTHIDSFQIIQIRIFRIFCIVRIEFARNLYELIPEVRDEPTRRDYKWTVCAMSRPPSWNLIRLDLLTLNRGASGVKTLLLTFLSSGMRSFDPHPGFLYTVSQSS